MLIDELVNGSAYVWEGVLPLAHQDSSVMKDGPAFFIVPPTESWVHLHP